MQKTNPYAITYANIPARVAAKVAAVVGVAEESSHQQVVVDEEIDTRGSAPDVRVVAVLERAAVAMEGLVIGSGEQAHSRAEIGAGLLVRLAFEALLAAVRHRRPRGVRGSGIGARRHPPTLSADCYEGTRRGDARGAAIAQQPLVLGVQCLRLRRANRQQGYQ